MRVTPGAVGGRGAGRRADPRLAQVRAALWDRVPVDGREARARHRALVALGRLPRPFDREADLTHVTGSALVTGQRGVLLHFHKRLGMWLQPGGHLEGREAPWEAARREAHEETGLAAAWAGVDEHGVPPLCHVDVHEGGRGHVHLDLRYHLVVTGSDRPAPRAGESQEVRWFSWDEALAVADPGLAGLLRHARPG